MVCGAGRGGRVSWCLLRRVDCLQLFPSSLSLMSKMTARNWPWQEYLIPHTLSDETGETFFFSEFQFTSTALGFPGDSLIETSQRKQTYFWAIRIAYALMSDLVPES